MWNKYKMAEFGLGTRVKSTVTYKGKVHSIAGRITGVEVTFDKEIDDFKESSFFSDDGRDLQMQNVVFHRVGGGEVQHDVTLGPLVKEAAAAAAGGAGGNAAVAVGGRRRSHKKQRQQKQKQSRSRRH